MLITSIDPYFLEKGNVWFEEHMDEILEARKNQSFFQDNTLYLRQGAEEGLSLLLRKLDEFGYEKVFQVRDPGEFSRLGGTLEIFPITKTNAVRIEFLGNTVESMEELAVNADEETTKTILKKRLQSQKTFSDLQDLKPGDFLVHIDHGVAKFAGIKSIGSVQYYLLQYAQEDKLFVPVGLERKLSRYVGFADPPISRLGSSVWTKTKKRVREDIEKTAKELLELYAQREVSLRPPYGPPEELTLRVQHSFPYQETPDQIQALKDIERDLLKQEPMDRIVCGDVGFGKTEIALRAMIRAVEQGYQAAILSPTTILALQHFQNFTERVKDLPLTISVLSRLQNAKEEQKTLQNIREGTADIIVGTHRLLSRDVQFKNLGLLVIDDEQRFGVKQKEKLRQMRTGMDTLSLSATPIPRTLYMSLASLKGLSIMQTAPQGRIPVQIFVERRKESVIKKAITQELDREGQVYYLHNRIGTIYTVAKHLNRLFPRAKIRAIHGQIGQQELRKTMDGFRDKEYDILVATTIIENGIDLPNVNTLIVEDATKLGLSQAYQIRGRVGRSSAQSYAYFLYGSRLQEKAKLRLSALREAGLGSGYKIALRDMEIRGAGNILGKEQSGSVNALGLNLYCQMLSEAVEKLKHAR